MKKISSYILYGCIFAHFFVMPIRAKNVSNQVVQDALNDKLFAVVWSEDVTPVKSLLAAGASCNYKKNGSTVLHGAIESKSVETIKMLLAAGAKVNVQNNDGDTPLHYAVLSGSVEIVKLLLTAGAKVNVQNNDGDTPLHCAIARPLLEMVKPLLAAGAQVNIQNNKGDSALHKALCIWDEGTIRLLLAAGAQVNMQNKLGNSPLHCGFLFGVGKKLFSAEDTQAKNYLTCNLVRFFLGVPRSAVKSTGLVSIIRDLLAAGAAVTIQNNVGDTVLHIAVLYGSSLEVINALVDAGSQVNIQNNDGDTPLHLAAAWGCVETAKILLATGAQVNLQNKNGNSPLHKAALFGYESYSSDKARQTCFEAQAQIYVKMAKLLLDAGAQINLQNDDGKIPADVAEGDKVAQLLKSAAAQRTLK